MMTSPAADGSHLGSDAVVALAYYNLGINNNEVKGKAWHNNKTNNEQRLVEKEKGYFCCRS